MVQKVIWTESGYSDLQKIVEYISEDSTYYGLTFYEDVMGKAQTLNQFPHRGRVVPEIGDPNMREFFIHRYRLVYKITDEFVVITTSYMEQENLKTIDEVISWLNRITEPITHRRTSLLGQEEYRRSSSRHTIPSKIRAI